MTNPIVTENLNTGSTGWQLTQAASTQIAGYVSATSVNTGDTLNIYVSTQVASTTYSINVYRLGWYGGTGGRLMTTIAGQTGVAQGYYDSSAKILHNCPTAFIDGTTNLLEARWTSSYALIIPGTWITGSYLVVLIDANGFQQYTHFVVKGNTTADYIIVRPSATDAAYNAWGGHSLYAFNSASGVVATKVSFDRPSDQQNGSGGTLVFEMSLIKWLERQGLNLSYISDIDMHVNSAQLKGYKAYLSIGHDEYWTKEMYDGVTAARDAGIGLAFMGADDIDTQVRLETGGQNGANRTVTCYRVTTSPNTLASDPFYSVDNTRVTASWSDPVLNRPQNVLLGIKYTSYVTGGSNVAWTVDAAAISSYLVGTGLVPGNSYGYDLVGYEFDKVQAGGPSNLLVIGTSPITDINSQANTSSTTTYLAASGALVFAAGSMNWMGCLDTYRYAVQAGGTPAEIPAMQAFFTNILAALIINHKVFSMLRF